MKRWLAVAAAAAAVWVAGVSCKEKGRPDPSVRMAISHELAVEPQGGSTVMPGGGGDAPTQLDVPPEVTHAWSGVRIGWKDKKDGKEGTIDVPLGGSAPLPDPNLVVRADVFLPAFTMGGGAITSDGVEPKNPAARIQVLEKGNPIFGGWIFTNFPDVHPFTHPRFQLSLAGGIPKAGK